ncbi:hypothetical protein H0H87_003519 [Tephrocybe sp. NHM501043]|nr:hypothetical protein H0H87_003519 [Tephrocybe sp. NHM501043]
MSTKPSERSTQWLRAISASGPLLPSLISFFFPPITLSLFTPRQVINDNNLWSFLFGIWASPTSFSGHISRAIQTTFVFFLPASTFQHYWLWLFVATLRTCVGQLLTRVVGWAAPQFFSHWALYEAFGGYGPSITVYIFLNGGPSVVKPLFRRLHKASDLILLVCLSALFCWLDDSPWTYGVAILGAGAIALALWVIRLTSDRTLHPMLPDIQKQASPPKLKMIIESAVLALFVISLPYAIHDRLADSTITDMPPAHSATSPLLDIIVLSFPRPDIEASMKIMATTINSYLPHVNSNVTLSVFTHSTSHTAFIDIRKLFASANITFYTDADEHPDYWSGQYLHIAEAFRWAVERPTHAEWVMLVEDDFPLCGGDRGWDALKRVMQILEARSSSQGNTNRQGGFIGTGGRYGISPLASSTC